MYGPHKGLVVGMGALSDRGGLRPDRDICVGGDLHQTSVDHARSTWLLLRAEGARPVGQILGIIAIVLNVISISVSALEGPPR